MNEYEYTVYLLRVWCDERQHEWHATLTQPDARQVRQFADLDGLVAFLQTQFGIELPAETTSLRSRLD